ncbi:MAG: thioredoxin domain-containing protein [Candidatus Woesearchaeota archaeon]
MKATNIIISLIIALALFSTSALASDPSPSMPERANAYISMKISPASQEAIAGTSAKYILTVEDMRSCNLVAREAGVTLGNPEAPRVDVYEDFECPYCAAAMGVKNEQYTLLVSQDSTWQPALTGLISLAEQNKIYLVHHDFPIESIHPNAFSAAVAARCAAEQGKFWEYAEQLYAHNTALSTSIYNTLASNMGLDTTAFKSCILTGEQTYGNIIRAETPQHGGNSGVTGTPAFFVEGKLISGAQSFSVFLDELGTLQDYGQSDCSSNVIRYTLSAQRMQTEIGDYDISVPDSFTLHPGQTKQIPAQVVLSNNVIPYRINFGVDATGTSPEGYSIYNSVQASLNVVDSNPIYPPSVPGQNSITIKLFRGWNLVSVPGVLDRFEQVDSSQKMLGFIGQGLVYQTLQQARNSYGTGFGKLFADHAFWVYSFEPQKIRAYYTKAPNAVQINAGWSLVPVRETYVGRTIASITQTCSLQSAYLWDGASQQWRKMGTDYLVSSADLGQGWLFRTGRACTLGEVSVPVPSAEQKLCEQTGGKWVKPSISCPVGGNCPEPPFECSCPYGETWDKFEGCADQKPTPQYLCQQSGGSWNTFGNSCADKCDVIDPAAGAMYCAQVTTSSCDCGSNMCWNGNSCVKGTSYQDQTHTGGVHDIMSEGETRTYTLEGVDYEVTVVFVTANTAKFSVNSELTDELTEGQTELMTYGLQLKLVNINGNKAEFEMKKQSTSQTYVEDTLREGETKTYTLVYEEFEITAVFISDTQSVKFNVNGRLTPEFYKGQTAGAGGVWITIKDVLTNDRDGTVEFKAVPGGPMSGDFKDGFAAIDTLNEGETKIYTIGGNDYEMTNLFIPENQPYTVKLSVNGQIFDSMLSGGEINTPDGKLKIDIKGITHDKVAIVIKQK